MTAKCLLPTRGVLLVCGTSFAQPLPYSYDLPSPGSSTPWPGYSPGGAGMVVVEDHPLTTDYPVAETHPSHAAPAGQGCRCGDCCCNSMSCPGACCPAAFTAGPYGGAEFLWVRAHFSEALAFATGTVLGLQPFVAQVQGTELDFDYQASFRTFLGYHLSPATDIQFTYWRLDTSTDVNGAVLLPNQFIMDPFGHQANPGDSIFTNAEVNLNVYDFDVIRSTAVDESRLTLRYVAGIRVADIQQSYTSLINNPA
ncbi:MAG: hypothetical protein HY000_03470, partial [Planctomycetes bacterium]|nr:hypothetical protein [Planctomycetota bacterium]